MGIASKRNGKILMGFGLLLIAIGFIGFEALIAMFGEASIYTPLSGLFVFLLVLIGPVIALVGIPLFIIGSKRLPSKLMEILKSTKDKRAKVSFLSQQLDISEKDVISTLSRLKSNGEPILIDDSTLEAVYNSTLSPQSTKIKKPSMTFYEKLTVILTIIGILVSILVALLT